MRGKFFGQINLVLMGQRYLAANGSFTLTSGIFADEAWPGVTGGGVISGGLHSFVLSAAIELPRGLRINVVSPTMVADSINDFGHLFPGMKPAPMNRLVEGYVSCFRAARPAKLSGFTDSRPTSSSFWSGKCDSMVGTSAESCATNRQRKRNSP